MTPDSPPSALLARTLPPRARLLLPGLVLVLLAGCTSSSSDDSARPEGGNVVPDVATSEPSSSASAAASLPGESSSPGVPSSAGRYVVTAGDVLRLHDPVTGALVRTLQRTPEGAVDSQVAFSRDGDSVYALREYGGFASCGRTQVVSVATGGGPVRSLVDVPTRIGPFAVSPDRTTVAYQQSACEGDGTAVLVLRDLDSGTARRVELPNDDERSQSGLAFSPDSRSLFVDGRVVDVRADDPVDGSVLVEVPERLAVDAQYRADGKLVLTTALLADSDAPLALVVVDPATGKAVGPGRTLPDDVGAVSYGPTGGDLVGIRFPDEGDDYVGGSVVRVRGGAATPLGRVEALAVDWT